MLFKDRYRGVLKSLKIKGYLDQDAKVKDFKEAKQVWYDSYNRFGDDRVLNPYSIQNFSAPKILNDFLPQSAHPTRLSELVSINPLDFMQPPLNSYPSEDIRQPELGKLEAVPVIFHSGYLTIDRLFLTDTFIGNEPPRRKRSRLNPQQGSRVVLRDFLLPLDFRGVKSAISSYSPKTRCTPSGKGTPGKRLKC
jgi:hypothetical protein